MKKTIRLTESELKKVIKKILVEQNTQNRMSVVKSAYDKIVDASSGPGTDPDEILNAFNMLKDSNELSKLLSLFKDKKTGYSTFEEMVNSEYGEFNLSDIKKLSQRLYDLGSMFTYQSDKGLFMGNFTYKGLAELKNKVTGQDLLKCQQSYKSALPQAIKFWKDWLSNPIIKQKIKQNWESDDLEQTLGSRIYNFFMGKSVDEAYEEYFELFNNIKLIFYDNSMFHLYGNVLVSYIAFVNGPNGKIYCNCSRYKETNLVATLIHEIQHMLYDIKPINPEKKLTSVFINKNTKLETPAEIKSTLSTSYSRYEDLSKKLNLKVDTLLYWSERYKSEAKGNDPDYVCRPTENASRIISMRNVLGLKPGENMTYEMLKPYINNEKRNENFYWFLLCWAKNNFPDMNQLLNKLNQLAAKNVGQNKLYT